MDGWLESNMDTMKDKTFQELMQMIHDMGEMKKDFDMITEFISVDELKTMMKK